MVVTAFMGSLQARAIDEAARSVTNRAARLHGLAATLGCRRRRCVVQCLNVEQGLGGLPAGSDPGQMAEILESLDAGSDHDQQIGV